MQTPSPQQCWLWLLLVAGWLQCCSSRQQQTTIGAKIPVVVDTDLGGDPDDIQSLFRLLHYSDMLHIKGIVSTPNTDLDDHPWDTVPQTLLIEEWVRRIDLDYLRARGYDELMEEAQVLEVVRQGSQRPGRPYSAGTTAGSDWIIKMALEHTPADPLWILIWGSLTTTAQALYDEPAIAPNIRIYSIGSSNTLHDSLSRNFVYEFMAAEFPDLWWIENGRLPRGSHETFRGVYQGGEQSGEWGNVTFVEANIRGRGSYHNGLFAQKSGDAFPVATWPQGTLKEGDSPSILFLVSPAAGGVGDINDPTAESWGGTFRKPEPLAYPNYYCDLAAPPEVCQATINKWRPQFLAHWKERWQRYETDKR